MNKNPIGLLGLKRTPVNPKVTHLPNHAGVYGVVLNGLIVYVGSSKRVRVRCTSYLSINKVQCGRSVLKSLKGDLTFVLLEDCKYLDKESMLLLERCHILANKRVINMRDPVTSKLLKNLTDADINPPGLIGDKELRYEYW